MAKLSKIAGIILAGGQSSRMGKNKALLDYHGKPLVQHMIDTVHSCNIDDVFISGLIENFPSCIADEEIGLGPAHAIKNILKKLPNYEGYLFVPVDMPLLTTDILQTLLSYNNGAYFTSWPLPVFITSPISSDISSSVHEMLKELKTQEIELPINYKKYFINANTPEEWQKVLKNHECKNS